MITSFYSYKGGVGRTQLLVNIAAYLCYYKDRKILLLEWDIEAPGLHYFFGLKNKDVNKEGLLDVFEKYCLLVKEKGNDLKPNERPYFTLENTVRLTNSESKKGYIDLIPAGKYCMEKDYFNKASDFNWYEFHELLDGKSYLEFVKTKLKDVKIGFDYDFIFIDSRTGIHDYTHISNIQMSECNVLVMAPNKQNFEGCRFISDRILDSPYVKSENKYRKPKILPVLSRIDIDNDDAGKWINNFAREFSYLINEYTTEAQRSDFNLFKKYTDKTIIRYNSNFSSGENLLFNPRRGSIVSNSIMDCYKNVSEYLEAFTNETEVFQEESLKNVEAFYIKTVGIEKSEMITSQSTSIIKEIYDVTKDLATNKVALNRIKRALLTEVKLNNKFLEDVLDKEKSFSKVSLIRIVENIELNEIKAAITCGLPFDMIIPKNKVTKEMMDGLDPIRVLGDDLETILEKIYLKAAYLKKDYNSEHINLYIRVRNLYNYNVLLQRMISNERVLIS